MPQIYLFIGGLLAITVIVTRRSHIFNRNKRWKFKEEVAQKVDEFQKERQLMHQERFKETLLKEQKGKKYDFSQFKLVLRKADMAMAKQQWIEAKKLLIQSLALTKEELPVSLKLATVYMESGDLKRAESLYKRLAEIDHENPAVYESLAKIYLKKKRFKEAVQAYVQAIGLDENDDRKLVALGRLYQLLMRPSLAGECYRRAAELKPREVDYLFLLADACKGAEDYENALFTYEKILTLEPYNEKARNSAQDVRIKMNEIEKVMIP
ncbi:tetratricopeptide repeat protein [Patescibacteria group bacterium]|nr:tetratricopeptide repeat protein [Patescibacteria group bacterium]